MLTSTLTIPAASVRPGFSVVKNESVGPSALTLRTRSAKPTSAMSVASMRTGHSSSGAAKYQIANVTGSHASAINTKRDSEMLVTPGLRTARLQPAANAAGGGIRGGSPAAPGARRTQTSQTISTSSMISACHT